MLQFVCLAIYIYYIVLILRILLSWATMVWSPPPAMDPVVRVIYDLTEPVMGLFRRYIPPVGGLDLSPLILFIILRAIQEGLGCR